MGFFGEDREEDSGEDGRIDEEPKGGEIKAAAPRKQGLLFVSCYHYLARLVLLIKLVLLLCHLKLLEIKILIMKIDTLFDELLHRRVRLYESVAICLQICHVRNRNIQKPQNYI